MITFVIKPIYEMISKNGKNTGQPLKKIKLACIPNGILLTHNPNYIEKYPELFYPGKDDSSKNIKKIRARVSFDKLYNIATWRVTEVFI